MKKKQLKFRIQSIQPSSNEHQSIKIFFEDEHFLKSIDIKRIPYPENFLKNCIIDHMQKQITIKPKLEQFKFEELNEEEVNNVFAGLTAYHVKYTNIQEDEDQLKSKMTFFKDHDIWGFKKFHVAQGRFERGDFLFYAKSGLKQFLTAANTFTQNKSLLFDLDSIFIARNIPLKYARITTQILIKQNSQQIKKLANEIDLNIQEINSKIDSKGPKKPYSFIRIIINGNIMNIHYLYEAMEQILINNFLQIVEIEDPEFVSQTIDNLPQFFPEYKNKIFKLSTNAVLLLDSALNSQEVRRKLKLKIWAIGQQTFQLDEIHTLQAQFKNKALKKYMIDKRIFWDNLIIGQNTLHLTCDKATKNKFVEQAKNLLKTYIKQTEQCRNFDNNLMIEIFRKYFQATFEDKFGVEFQFHQNYMMRTNFTKYAEEIQQQLKNTREKIRKKLITFVSLNPIKNIPKHKLFSQVEKPSGYDHNLLGCNLYKMDYVRIKMKPFKSLKRQQECIAYVIDDRLETNSTFYKIIDRNNLNYVSFLKDAHKTKKPDRLRQYITQECPYTRKTVLLHAGREKVTQTLKRDLEGLFSLFDRRLCIALFLHEDDFYKDVLKTILEEIDLRGYQIYQNVAINPNNTSFLNNASPTKTCYEVDFYYEGDNHALYEIEKVVRALKISKISSFVLQQLDIQKIYALQYYQMHVKFDHKTISLSPIIAQLCDYEIRRSVRKNAQNKKKFIFSTPLELQRNQLVEFIISTKSELHYKITHQNGANSWSRLPHIEKIQEFDHELNQIVGIIKKYFFKTDYTVISAESISDGVHGRAIKYIKNYYMARDNETELIPVILNIENGKILQDATKPKLQFMLNENKLINYYEITTYKEELQNINELIKNN